jgi:hypothetical protein
MKRCAGTLSGACAVTLLVRFEASKRATTPGVRVLAEQRRLAVTFMRLLLAFCGISRIMCYLRMIAKPVIARVQIAWTIASQRAMTQGAAATLPDVAHVRVLAEQRRLVVACEKAVVLLDIVSRRVRTLLTKVFFFF